MQLTVLSDVNATDFVNRVTVPIFRDPSAGRQAWRELDSGAVKHDTFVFAPTGERTLFWDTSARDFAKWSAEIRAAVEAIGR